MFIYEIYFKRSGHLKVSESREGKTQKTRQLLTSINIRFFRKKSVIAIVITKDFAIYASLFWKWL